MGKDPAEQIGMARSEGPLNAFLDAIDEDEGEAGAPPAATDRPQLPRPRFGSEREHPRRDRRCQRPDKDRTHKIEIAVSMHLRMGDIPG
jgi:hypothetical protein